MVYRLRNSNEYIRELALLAEINEEVVGYSLLTKINIKNENESIEKAKNLGYSSIVVLGHPSYYSKFGFINANEFYIKPPPFEVSNDVFKVLVLNEDKFKGTSGVVEYSSAFFE